jgi:predicted glycogen debranching enzyme
MSVLDPRTFSFDELIEREWLIVDGAGGYASSTVIGLNTRKYHGVLVAAARAPFGRLVVVPRVEETVVVNGRSWALASVEYPGVIHPDGHALLRAFEAAPYPRWLYQAGDWTIEKSLRFTPGVAGEVVLTYTLLGGGADDAGETWRDPSASNKTAVELVVRPLIALRPIHELSYRSAGRFEPPNVDASTGTIRIIESGEPRRTVHVAHDGTFAASPDWYLSTVYRRERERGYAAQEDLWTPGVITLPLAPGKRAKIAFSLAPVDLQRTKHRLRQCEADRSATKDRSRTPPDADRAVLKLLEETCAQFFASPQTIVPQFPWSALSPRDMLIAFPGVLLARDALEPAARVLQALAGHLHGGLLPSQLDETGDAATPAYESADASLWLIHAIWSYHDAGGDAEVTRALWPAVAQVLDAYVAGTKSMGIGLDADTLLRVREPGSTWMNARIGSSTVTPRAGRPVELNALWHNALLAAADLAERLSPVGSNASTVERLRSAAAVHKTAFNRRFWNAPARCLFDVVYDNGADGSIRPNQLLAISLPFPVLQDRFAAAALRTVRDKLLTPLGLRTLDPADKEYRGRFGGDVQARDRAYHQGSVFPWLLGPYLTALVNTLGASERTVAAARSILRGAIAYLVGDGLGQIAELFDGDDPHRPGGAIADARAAGELLSAWKRHVVRAGQQQLPNGAGTSQLSATVGQAPLA